MVGERSDAPRASSLGTFRDDTDEDGESDDIERRRSCFGGPSGAFVRLARLEILLESVLRRSCRGLIAGVVVDGVTGS